MDIGAFIHDHMSTLSEVYRVFDEEEYRNRSLAGYVWITTLESCRNAETEGRKDEGEGTLIHMIESIDVDGRDQQSVDAISQTGVFRADQNTRGVQIRNLSFHTGYPNFYALCMTEAFEQSEMADDFGDYWVCIKNPEDFFVKLTECMARRFSIIQAIYAPMSYSGRTVINKQIAEAPSPFLKPRDKYSHQREVRMIWNVAPQHHPLKPFELYCPQAATHISALNP